jgi:hypothetical protein
VVHSYSTRNMNKKTLLGSGVQPVREADFTAMCELIF